MNGMANEVAMTKLKSPRKNEVVMRRNASTKLLIKVTKVIKKKVTNEEEKKKKIERLCQSLIYKKMDEKRKIFLLRL